MIIDSSKDNGEPKKELPESPEERAIRRRKLWEENPESFLHISELIIGTRLLPSGLVQCIVSMPPNQLLLEISCTRIHYEVNKILSIIEMETRKQAQPKIVKPGSGIMNFVRGKD